MKQVKISIYELVAIAIIFCAVALRVILAAVGWPATNADEGTMGIMALHIAYRGETPLLFYGQNYMGVLEAYLGAGFFRLLGPSLFSLRLGVILLTTLFFVSMYLLTSQLYSKSLAVVTLLLLCFGSIPVFSREMLATGGSTQTLLFGSLAFLFAVLLAKTYRMTFSWRLFSWKLLGYFGWGMVIGLGLWSDMVVLPFFAMAALLLCAFCWRDLLRWAWLPVLLGLVLGAWPLILYNMQSIAHSKDSFSTLLGLFQGSTTQAPHTLRGILHGFKSTVLVSVPIATGDPFCPVQELPWLGDNTAQTTPCVVGHAIWGFGYLALLLWSICLTIFSLLRINPMISHDTRRAVLFGRLALLGSGLLAIGVYGLSSAPMGWPGFHARYLVGLLMVAPAVIAPLWDYAGSWFSASPKAPTSFGSIGSSLVLLAIFTVLIIGTSMLLSEVPAALAADQREAALIQSLESHGVSHVYTDYWSCDDLAFVSDERIICAVIDGNMQLSHNRDPRYAQIVGSDAHSSYLLPMGAVQLAAVAHLAALHPGKYHSYTLYGYVVYQPSS